MQTIAIQPHRVREGIETFVVRLDEAPRDLMGRHRRRLASLPIRVILFSCVVLAFGAAGAEFLSRTADARSVDPTPLTIDVGPAAVSPWLEIVRPIPLYEVAGAAIGRLPLDYRARRRQGADERQDFLSFGHFGDDGPFLGLSILRATRSPGPPADFFVDMARLGADQTLAVSRIALPTLLSTRFGPFAIADLTMTRGKAASACLGFRLEGSGDAPRPVDIGGFACGTGDRAMDRALLGCILDRIDLLSAGDDDGLRDFFVAAERRRGQPCATSRQLAVGTRDRWLNGESAAPALRKTVPRGHTT